jgi:hypothetical protein
MGGDESSPHVIMLDYRRISGGSMHEPDCVFILLKFIILWQRAGDEFPHAL